jgi:hypothetical protein
MNASGVSLLTRVGSAAAATAIAVSGVMATASTADAATTSRVMTPAAAASHVRKLPTSLSIRKVDHPRRHFDVISGALRSLRVPLRDEVVVLERRSAGTRFHAVAAERTHRHGGWVAFRVRPAVVWTRYVLVFRGSPNFRHSHSGVVTVRARA